jgi:hypothetical protein
MVYVISWRRSSRVHQLVSLYLFHAGSFFGLFFGPEGGVNMLAPSKYRLTFNGLHSVISQMIELYFILICRVSQLLDAFYHLEHDFKITALLIQPGSVGENEVNIFCLKQFCGCVINSINTVYIYKYMCWFREGLY